MLTHSDPDLSVPLILTNVCRKIREFCSASCRHKTHLLNLSGDFVIHMCTFRNQVKIYMAEESLKPHLLGEISFSKSPNQISEIRFLIYMTVKDSGYSKETNLLPHQLPCGGCTGP